MARSSDEDDGDYVPEADAEEEDEHKAIHDDRTLPTKPSVTTDAHVDKLWGDMNRATTVSASSIHRTAKLLGNLTTQRSESSRSRMKRDKRKVHEFSSFPILGVDGKRSRKEMADVVATQKVDRMVTFAGQEYRVSTTDASGTAKREKRGLDHVLQALDEPKKVSTMEKSSLDWDKFKEKEGIQDELTQYTKDGYIEKQEFLQRLDLKRFEIEKAARDKQRKQLLQQQTK
ncbi:hypothetical protein PsorP6_014033 [Peronosclerospora sorghi]|uniref:Uncharacterized protein n=1 Tax=Peronosclerospora sorghi TaxID=230839 RepID=A0ACC0VIQ8_9STRA|nr:hypothetical protein PsorP6_014033 [Peronosclerospora sorghi]